MHITQISKCTNAKLTDTQATTEKGRVAIKPQSLFKLNIYLTVCISDKEHRLASTVVLIFRHIVLLHLKKSAIGILA